MKATRKKRNGMKCSPPIFAEDLTPAARAAVEQLWENAQRSAAREHPILFSAPMACALLDGTKTQTRRVMRARDLVRDADGQRVPCPYGVPGDRLWVRETWCKEGGLVTYRADGDWIAEYKASGQKPLRPRLVWRPSIFMRREHSRITLEVTDVRVQRLQDISDADIAAEGVLPYVGKMIVNGAPATGFMSAERYFAALWNTINGERPGCAWRDNPLVWAITFRRVEGK